MAKSIAKQMSLTVESGITYIAPTTKNFPKETQIRVNWPFLEMKHGDSFILPSGQVKKVKSAIGALQRRGHLTKTASYRTLPIDSEYHRVWLFNV